MSDARPVIIEAAINGGTTKARNPHVPRSVDEIVNDALACIELGATIVHNHHDGPPLGPGRLDATPYLATYERIRRVVPAAILYPTMGGGGADVTGAERYEHVEALRRAGHIRMSPLDPGSVNLGGADADGLPVARNFVYQNSFADVRFMMDYCREHALAPSLSIFEPGFLRAVLAYHAAGKLPAGSLVKLYFGGGTLGFGLPPTPKSLDAYLAMLDGTGLPWSVAVLGGDVLGTIADEAVRQGGHLRIGLEDFAAARTPSNVELMRETVALLERLGCRPATGEETNGMLGMPRTVVSGVA